VRSSPLSRIPRIPRGAITPAHGSGVHQLTWLTDRVCPQARTTANHAAEPFAESSLTVEARGKPGPMTQRRARTALTKRLTP